MFRDRIAVIDGDRRYTYAKLGARVNCLAQALRGAGIERGQRVAVLAPNSAPMIEAHFGIALAAPLIMQFPAIAQACEHQPVPDARNLLFIQSQPGDGANGSGNKQESIGVPARTHRQVFRKEGGDCDAGKIVVAHGGMATMR